MPAVVVTMTTDPVGNLQGSRENLCEMAFTKNGFMVTVYPEWLRAPETPVNIAELDAFGVTACLCACKAASDAGRQLGNCEESIDAGRQVSTSSNDQLLAGVHEKHFAQRYRYFSKFDKGVRVDFEGWFSVCPEVIAINRTN